MLITRLSPKKMGLGLGNRYWVPFPLFWLWSFPSFTAHSMGDFQKLSRQKFSAWKISLKHFMMTGWDSSFVVLRPWPKTRSKKAPSCFKWFPSHSYTWANHCRMHRLYSAGLFGAMSTKVRVSGWLSSCIWPSTSPKMWKC